MKYLDWTSETANENIGLLNDYATRSYTWRYNSLLMEGARFGHIYSPEEYKQMMMMRLAPVSLNIGTAILESAEALMLGIKPVPKVAPLAFPYAQDKQQISQKVAQLYEFLLSKDFQESFGNLQIDRIIRDQSNTGRGTGQIIPVFENGEFYTKFVRLPWRYYFPDPGSIDEFYEDADAHIYAFPMAKKLALRYLRTKIPNLTQRDFEDYFTKGSVADKAMMFGEDSKYFLGKRKDDLMFINRMTLEDQTILKVLPLRPTKNEEEAELLANLTNRVVTDEEDVYLQKALKSKLVSYEKRTDELLVHYISVGGLGFKEVFPLKTHTVVSLQYDSRDNAFPQGRMQNIYSPLRVLNKFFMTALLNASLLNATRILAEEDSIIDQDNFVMSSSIPGAIIKYRLPIPGVSKPPEVIKATPLEQGWLTLPRFLIQIMEYVSGMFGIMQGNAERSPETFSTVASLQATGGARIRRRMNDVDIFLSKVGKVQAELYKNYAPPQGFRSYIDEKSGEYDYKMFNVLELKKDENQRYKTIIAPETDLSFGIKGVVFSSKGSTGYETANTINSMTTLATQLNVPELVPLILQLHNIPGTEEVINKVTARGDLVSQNSALQQQLKEVERKTNIYQNQIFQLIQAVERAKAKGKSDVILKELSNIVEGIRNNGQQQVTAAE